MAPQAPRIAWSEQTFASFLDLSAKDRAAILKRLEWLESFPEMYPVEETGRWAGLQRFFAGSQVVYYGYWHGERVIYVEVVAPLNRPHGV